MSNIQNKPIIKVIETREVYYRKKSFLFFSWKEFISSISKDKSIHIFSNDETIKEVYFNGRLLTVDNK